VAAVGIEEDFFENGTAVLGTRTLNSSTHQATFTCGGKVERLTRSGSTVYTAKKGCRWQVRTAKRTKRAAHARLPLAGATRPNQRWSMDFVSDRFGDGRWFRILTVVDQYTRECLCVYAELIADGYASSRPDETLGRHPRRAGIDHHG
jgi:transposase InsO family protein